MATDDELRAILRSELAPIAVRLSAIEAQLAAMRAHIDGLPLVGRKMAVIEQEIRMLRAAFNDFARTNVTSGEIQALHDDVNRVSADNVDLATRLATVERLLREMQERGGAS